MTNAFYWAITRIVRAIVLPLYARVEASGLENIPGSGPLIIASNHLNDADPGILSTRFPRRIVFMAKVELFRVPVLAQFLRVYGAFPVRRNEADLAALRRANEALKAGLAVCIFPEGTREGPPERLREGWPGAALVALRSDAPILPVAISGSGRMAMPGMFLRIFRRYRVSVAVGEPFHLAKPARVNAEAANAGTRVIMERIAALVPPERRGPYA